MYCNGDGQRHCQSLQSITACRVLLAQQVVMKTGNVFQMVWNQRHTLDAVALFMIFLLSVGFVNKWCYWLVADTMMRLRHSTTSLPSPLAWSSITYHPHFNSQFTSSTLTLWFKTIFNGGCYWEGPMAFLSGPLAGTICCVWLHRLELLRQVQEKDGNSGH